MDAGAASPTTFTNSDRALYDALELLEARAGIEPGEPFRVTRAAMIVESQLRPLTLDCSLYKLERDAVIDRQGTPGRGTTMRILRRA
jgi:hypothetical protein